MSRAASNRAPARSYHSRSCALTNMHATSQAGRVTLNVGGSLVTTAVSTLEAHSAYFRSLFSRWCLETARDQTVFLDCDYDAFRVLISYMRSGVVLLPREDVDLCSRVLLQVGSSPIPSTTSRA